MNLVLAVLARKSWVSPLSRPHADGFHTQGTPAPFSDTTNDFNKIDKRENDTTLYINRLAGGVLAPRVVTEPCQNQSWLHGVEPA